LLKELDHLTIVELYANGQRTAVGDLDFADPSTNDGFNFESKVSCSEGVELDEGVSQLLPSCLTYRCDLDNVETVHRALVGQVNHTLGYQLLLVLRHRQVPDDPACHDISPSTSEVAWIDERTDDEGAIECCIRRGFEFGSLDRHPTSLQFTHPLVPFLVELTIVGDNHGKANACSQAQRMPGVPCVFYLKKVGIQ
jgi:hypothetical protein